MCHFVGTVKDKGKCVIMLGWRSDRVIVSAL